METKFNFKSAICTSREQSERLLALGLKKETADCCYYYYDGEYLIAFAEDAKYPSDIPSWSLHRLIEMIPEYFADTKLEFRSEAVKWLMKQEGNVYDNLVILIEDCIKNGIFNKEHLEE